MSTEVNKSRLSASKSPVRFSRTPERHYLSPNTTRLRDFPTREKSPFFLGENIDLNVASQQAIIDKAAIMDVSGGVYKNIDDYITLFLTEYCVIDRAGML